MISVVKWWSTSCLKVVNIRKVENSLVNFQSNKNINLLLKNIFADVYHLQKMFNDVVCDVFHIVEDIISCKLLINILFAVCKLFIWISASCLQDEWCCWNCYEMFYKDIISANNVYKVKRLLRLFAMWLMFVEIVRCDLSIAKELLRWLLTMIIFFYEYDKRC